MVTKNKIVFILPFYGKLPPYFGLFLKGLEGKALDVLFVSDLTVRAAPSNFKTLRMPFAEFKQLIDRKLSVQTRIENLIKLCDLKPMLGEIMDEYIRDYEYWMFGDCDLVYGNGFNKLLEAVIRGGYDIYTVKKLWISGACCIVKNTPKCRGLYKRATNWAQIVTEPGRPTNIWFDECGGFFHHKLATGEMTMEDCSRERDSFAAAVFRSNDLKVCREDVLCECYLKRRKVVLDAKGNLTLDGQDIPIFHYVCAKRAVYFTYKNVPYEKIKHCLIDDTGFYFTPWQRLLRPVLRLCRKVRAAIRVGFNIR